MLCPISLTQSKRRKQIPISITPQNAGCKETREKVNLILRGLWDIYTHFFSSRLSISEQVEELSVTHGLTPQCCPYLCLTWGFLSSFWGQAQLKDPALLDAEQLCDQTWKISGFVRYTQLCAIYSGVPQRRRPGKVTTASQPRR